MRVGKHVSKNVSPEVRAEISRQNGLKGGANGKEIRPTGLPAQTAQALGSMKFRLKEEYKAIPEAVQLNTRTIQRMVDVMEGRVYSRKAPSILKATLAIRGEICEPVAEVHEHKGGISLVHAVAQAAGRIPAAVKLTGEQLKALDPAPLPRTVEGTAVVVPLPVKEKIT